MSYRNPKVMLDLLEDVREAIDGYVDTKDDEDGQPLPNWAMSLQLRIDDAIVDIERGDE